MGVSKLSAKVFLKVNYSFKTTIIWTAHPDSMPTHFPLRHSLHSSLPHYFIGLVFCAFIHSITLVPRHLIKQLWKSEKFPEPCATS